jgi:ABC-2 type transport system permease protein
MGYGMAGATIVFKRTAGLTNMLTNVMLFLNGALLPVDRLPGWLELIAKGLPTTQGIIVMRRVLFDGETLRALWTDGSIPFLIAHSAVLVLVGWLVFRFAQSVAMKRGLLGQY